MTWAHDARLVYIFVTRVKETDFEEIMEYFARDFQIGSEDPNFQCIRERVKRTEKNLLVSLALPLQHGVTRQTWERYLEFALSSQFS